MKLYPHQIEVLEKTKGLNKVAYYLDMGLGKTFVGSEKMMQLNEKMNLLICQKSKVDDWIEHFKTFYNINIFNLTKKKDFEMYPISNQMCVGIINYELIFRRDIKLSDFTLMLDESSMIQNELAKRTKYILKLNPKNVILLSGTPTSGKYEKLYSQLKLLGWDITKGLFYKQYVEQVFDVIGGYILPKIVGYKNVERLKRKLRSHGAIFMKSEEVFDLPEKIENIVNSKISKEYKTFIKDSIVTTNNIELIGDTSLTKLLYSRMLCGPYSENKINSLRDLINSTEDRLIIFYNFNSELEVLKKLASEFERPISEVNGQNRDLSNYENFENSIILIQYQAGSMGLNLQKANKIIYFTLPLSSELFEQSKKRIHRIGQDRTCFYYYLIVKNSIEEKILKTLELRKDYTDELFKGDINGF